MFDHLLDDAGREIRDQARALALEVPPELLKEMDANKVEYPRDFVTKAAAQKLLGIRFPKQYGGRGLHWVAEVTALEEIGVLGPGLGCAYSMPSIVGEALNLFGTLEQKENYLKSMLHGQKISAEALTEPRGGSDFFGTTTLAEKTSRGTWVLNGQKRFIVGGMGADFFLVYAKTSKTLPPKESLGVFLVDRAMGVKTENVYELMGLRGMGTARLVLKDVEVPDKNMVGRPGDGTSIFHRMMVPERMTSAAGALGAGRAAIQVAARYASLRKAFGTEIREFQGVSFKISESVAKLDAARALVYAAARSADQGLDSRKIVSEAKLLATEYAWEAINHSMQILGGIGYTNIYPIEKMLRDSRVTTIWTGSSEVMHLLIQHEYFKELLGERPRERDIEKDAVGADVTGEKIFE